MGYIYEKKIRQQLKKYTPEDKVYLKKDYKYSVLDKHNISDEEVNLLFNPKKIVRIYQNVAFPEERYNAVLDCGKDKQITVIFMFKPSLKGTILKDNVGIG
ncbi:hypothetical protein JXB41_07340 [Candidatus Woesearchaeota archaeon]|nr:hypothetical protein [Candidatus Woesearchaeota archaeon]